MNPQDCTNPAKPCGLHDPRNEWRIEVGSTTVHSGWFVAALVVIIALSTIWGLN